MIKRRFDGEVFILFRPVMYSGCIYMMGKRITQNGILFAFLGPQRGGKTVRLPIINVSFNYHSQAPEDISR